ncbi:VOC family protein [Streptomyces sp. NPDC003038]|uniref:VOC family protein n=1 Tax=unclassified Streptomyces TaxID=2593676 RepID=UPI0033BAA090
MAYTFQVTIDSAGPHPLADWWADALGWEVEPSDEEFIRAVVERLLAKGAIFLHEGSQGPYTWTTIADPEHNELCISH